MHQPRDTAGGVTSPLARSRDVVARRRITCPPLPCCHRLAVETRLRAAQLRLRQSDRRALNDDDHNSGRRTATDVTLSIDDMTNEYTAT